MNKLFLVAIAIFIGFGLLIDNSLVKPSLRKIASTHDSSPINAEANIDLSTLSAEDFSKAFKYQLMTSSRLIQTSEASGFELGNFYIRGSDNQKNFVCSKYPALELIFEADGIAISGSIPQMKVNGPCVTSDDYRSIEAFLIPYKKILATSVSQKDFQENLADSNAKLSIRFQDIVEEWPRQWNLVSIKLYSPESNETLSLNGYEIIAILGSPLTLQWGN